MTALSLQNRQTGLSLEEAIGLGAAAALHVALALMLILARDPPEPIPEPERIVVSLAEEVSLESTAPNPAQEAAAARAPELAPVPTPQEVAPPPPPPPPRPTPTASQRSRIRQTPTPTPTPSRSAPRSNSRQATTNNARPSPTPTPTRTRRGGNVASEFEDLARGSSQTSSDTRVPARQIGRADRASLLQSIAAQIDPHWDAPNGLDADLLSTQVTWRLNPNGSLDGQPTCRPTQGINDSNRTQAGRHCELAIRAIRLAEPFDLDVRYYEAWRLVTDFEFKGEF